MLRYTKEELLEYNAENRVPFSAKKESFEERFTRDPIREKINALSIIERENLIAEMQSVNDEKIKLVDEFNQSIDEGEELEKPDYFEERDFSSDAEIEE